MWGVPRIKSELALLGYDVAESTGQSTLDPDQFKELKDRLQQHYAEVRDAAPFWPAWEWPRYESQRIEWPEYLTQRKRK